VLKPWRKSANQLSLYIQYTDFIGLIFCLFVLVHANTDTNFSDSNELYTIGCALGLLVVIIHLVNTIYLAKEHPNQSEIVDFVFEIASFLWFLLLPFYLIPATTVFAQGFSPVFTMILFRKLTRQRIIELDDWRTIKSLISRFSVNSSKTNTPQVIALLICKESKKGTTLDFIAPSSPENLTPSEDKKLFGQRPLFRSTPYFFLDETNSTSHLAQYLIPSESTFQDLDLQSTLVVPPNLNNVRDVALAYFFQIDFFGVQEKENNGERFEIEHFLSNGHLSTFTHHIMNSQNETRTTYQITHDWNPQELSRVVGYLIGSIVSENVNEEWGRVSDYFEEKLRELYVRKGKQHVLAGIHFLCAVDLLNQQTVTECWEGMITSFSSTLKIMLPNFKSDGLPQGDKTELDWRKMLADITDKAGTILAKPVEEFIKYHDEVLNLAEKREDEKLYNILNETVQKTMDELQRTIYKRKLSKKGRYNVSQLISYRKGTVAGSTLALSYLARQISEGGAL